jgi:hypothetical protein
VPVYYDYQTFVTYRPTSRDRIRLGVYGASDRLDVLFARNESDPAVQGLKFGQQFHRAQLGWRHRYSQRLEHDIQLGLGRESSVTRILPRENLDLHTSSLYLRGEIRYRLSAAVQLIVGTDSQLGRFDLDFFGALPASQDSSEAGPEQNEQPLSYAGRGLSGDAAVYLEVPLAPTEVLRIVPGLRLEYDALIARYAFDPRLSILYAVTARTRLKLGAGVFSQPPQAREALTGFGNPNLLYNQAVHYGTGLEHNFDEHFSIGIECFYKNIYHRVVDTDQRAAAARGLLDPPPFDNGGIGRIYGVEVAGRKLASGRWFGFLSYTLMRSERKDHQDPWRLFNFDQTHIFTAASNVRLGRGWELGAVLRLVSGNPYTPIVGASYAETTGSYSPEFGSVNSRRAPLFNRIDVRAEKQWRFDHFRLAFYLDVQNAYNAKNREGVIYNGNFKESSMIRGLPIIPIIGLRGEL